jgi:N-acetylmuramoyl-L-alanine amidase
MQSNSKSILVSAGHTNVVGQDRGAAGNGFIEGNLSVELRDAVAAKLRELGGKRVVEDGFDGENQPLSKALNLARYSTIAVEFHWNAGPPLTTGVEVLSKPSKKALAQKIAKAIAIATGIKLRGEAGWKADNSGQHHRLAFCEVGGLIVEVCFISNADDMRRYRENFDAVVNAIAAVLIAA